MELAVALFAAALLTSAYVYTANGGLDKPIRNAEGDDFQDSVVSVPVDETPYTTQTTMASTIDGIGDVDINAVIFPTTIDELTAASGKLQDAVNNKIDPDTVYGGPLERPALLPENHLLPNMADYNQLANPFEYSPTTLLRYHRDADQPDDVHVTDKTPTFFLDMMEATDAVLATTATPFDDDNNNSSAAPPAGDGDLRYHRDADHPDDVHVTDKKPSFFLDMMEATDAVLATTATPSDDDNNNNSSAAPPAGDGDLRYHRDADQPDDVHVTDKKPSFFLDMMEATDAVLATTATPSDDDNNNNSSAAPPAGDGDRANKTSTKSKNGKDHVLVEDKCPSLLLICAAAVGMGMLTAISYNVTISFVDLRKLEQRIPHSVGCWPCCRPRPPQEAIHYNSAADITEMEPEVPFSRENLRSGEYTQVGANRVREQQHRLNQRIYRRAADAASAAAAASAANAVPTLLDIERAFQANNLRFPDATSMDMMNTAINFFDDVDQQRIAAAFRGGAEANVNGASTSDPSTGSTVALCPPHPALAFIINDMEQTGAPRRTLREPFGTLNPTSDMHTTIRGKKQYSGGCHATITELPEDGEETDCQEGNADKEDAPVDQEMILADALVLYIPDIDTTDATYQLMEIKDLQMDIMEEMPFEYAQAGVVDPMVVCIAVE